MVTQILVVAMVAVLVAALVLMLYHIAIESLQYNQKQKAEQNTLPSRTSLEAELKDLPRDSWQINCVLKRYSPNEAERHLQWLLSDHGACGSCESGWNETHEYWYGMAKDLLKEQMQLEQRGSHEE